MLLPLFAHQIAFNSGILHIKELDIYQPIENPNIMLFENPLLIEKHLNLDTAILLVKKHEIIFDNSLKNVGFCTMAEIICLQLNYYYPQLYSQMQVPKLTNDEAEAGSLVIAHLYFDFEIEKSMEMNFDFNLQNYQKIISDSEHAKRLLKYYLETIPKLFFHPDWPFEHMFEQTRQLLVFGAAMLKISKKMNSHKLSYEKILRAIGSKIPGIQVYFEKTLKMIDLYENDDNFDAFSIRVNATMYFG
eukprot:NODE_277_length_10928_cov_0.583987.p6 type:complete len:246 gc:universal NODE_277_length_10928_cov_0.583987:9974-10711(+)